MSSHKRNLTRIPCEINKLQSKNYLLRSLSMIQPNEILIHIDLKTLKLTIIQ